MSNEHSASAANLVVRGRDVNHQWTKSLDRRAAPRRRARRGLGRGPVVASFLRDRCELWVARGASPGSAQYHPVFRSCNRAFAQDPARRATAWCLECDKCLFVALVLAPFVDAGGLSRDARRRAARRPGARSPAAHPGRARRAAQALRVRRGPRRERRRRWRASAQSPQWRDVPHLARRRAPRPPRRATLTTSRPRKDRRVYRPTGFADLAGRRVGVFGFGVEGRAAARAAARAGRRAGPASTTPTSVDGRPRQRPRAATRRCSPARSCSRAPGSRGGAATSPSSRRRGVIVTSALNLWLHDADRDRVVAVTGTKGKSTTTVARDLLLHVPRTSAPRASATSGARPTGPTSTPRAGGSSWRCRASSASTWTRPPRRSW